MKTFINKLISSKIFTDCFTQIESYKHFYNSRKALAALDDNMLEDIGITRAEAEKEAAKPFWRSHKYSLIKNRAKTKQTKKLNNFNKVRP